MIKYIIISNYKHCLLCVHNHIMHHIRAFKSLWGMLTFSKFNCCCITGILLYSILKSKYIMYSYHTQHHWYDNSRHTAVSSFVRFVVAALYEGCSARVSYCCWLRERVLVRTACPTQNEHGRFSKSHDSYVLGGCCCCCCCLCATTNSQYCCTPTLSSACPCVFLTSYDVYSYIHTSHLFWAPVHTRHTFSASPYEYEYTAVHVRWSRGWSHRGVFLSTDVLRCLLACCLNFSSFIAVSYIIVLLLYLCTSTYLVHSSSSRGFSPSVPSPTFVSKAQYYSVLLLLLLVCPLLCAVFCVSGTTTLSVCAFVLVLVRKKKKNGIPPVEAAPLKNQDDTSSGSAVRVPLHDVVLLLYAAVCCCTAVTTRVSCGRNWVVVHWLYQIYGVQNEHVVTREEIREYSYRNYYCCTAVEKKKKRVQSCHSLAYISYLGHRERNERTFQLYVSFTSEKTEDSSGWVAHASQAMLTAALVPAYTNLG